MGKQGWLTLVIILLIGGAIAAIIISAPKKTDEGTKVNNAASPSPAVTPSPQVAPTVDIEALLALNPGAGASEAQLKEFSAKVSAQMIDSTTLDITGCAPKPQVIHTKLGQAITLKNSDAIGHKLVNGSTTLDAAADSEKAVTPSFSGPGIYGYSCDSKIVGIFLVTP